MTSCLFSNRDLDFVTMLGGLQVISFISCYTIALGLEIVSFRMRVGWRRLTLLTLVMLALVAQTLYLSHRASLSGAAPFSSPADWLLLSAWALAIVYLSTIFYLPQTATGLLFLPLVLALIGVSLTASSEPFSPDRASRFWGSLHASALLLGTVTVCVGFLAGLIYLLQSYGLKHAHLGINRLPLPSLEWLQRVNSRALAISTGLIGLGFASGVVLSVLKHHDQQSYVPWTDPVVLSLGAMLAWLVVAEVFRLVYPAARRGRKVAYLTTAAFLFLVITIGSLWAVGSIHGTSAPTDERSQPLDAPDAPSAAGNHTP